MMKKLFLFLMIIGLQGFCFAQGGDEKCPAPTKEQFSSVCQGIYNTEHSVKREFNYTYQEHLWSMSCADPEKDEFAIAQKKIEMMWNNHRQNFRCYNYPTSIATDKNITKFSLDNGFPGFIIELVRKYKLDLNFVDPADNKTILDFVQNRKDYIRKSLPIDQEKLMEYERISNFLKENGAKHSWELNQ